MAPAPAARAAPVHRPPRVCVFPNLPVCGFYPLLNETLQTVLVPALRAGFCPLLNETLHARRSGWGFPNPGFAVGRDPPPSPCPDRARSQNEGWRAATPPTAY
ncbi:MAG: hypothetical protein EA352_06825 [Gemmatimonadales bacterium]|nr:MAG: hypothetical protein EA352_06825 [Gemmatimonadales bacterium]